MEAVLARYDEGSDWVNNHPEEGGEIVEKYFESMKAKGVTASIPYARLAPLPAKDCQKYIEDFFNELQSTDSLKVIGGKLPDENFYYVSQ